MHLKSDNILNGAITPSSTHAPKRVNPCNSVSFGSRLPVKRVIKNLSGAIQNVPDDSFCGKMINFAKDGVEKYFKGKPTVFYQYGETAEEFKKYFGKTFDEYADVVKSFSSKYGKNSGKEVGRYSAGRFGIEVSEADNKITFYKHSLLYNALNNIKEFTVGNLLDLGVAARNLSKKAAQKLNLQDDTISRISKKFSSINSKLDKRVLELNARDSYYKLFGAFELANEGVKEIMDKAVNPSDSKALRLIKQNICNFAAGSLHRACKPVGNYNTSEERAFNRLATGFVSATFAATDFHNISMMQNNNEKLANEASTKRFWQDMRRQGITAGITYVILGAFQNKVNKSLFHAVMSLGGVAFIAEILSRKIGGISLVPLTPEKAAKIAEEREALHGHKDSKKSEKEQNNDTKVEKPEPKDVFSIFTDKISDNGTLINFTSSPKTQDSNFVKKKSSIPKNILKGVAGVAVTSLLVGFARTRNILGFNDFVNNTSKAIHKITRDLTSKYLVLDKNDVDGLINFMKEGNLKTQYNQVSHYFDNPNHYRILGSDSNIVKKYIPKNQIRENGQYYLLGKVEDRTKKAIFNVLTYPFSAVARIFNGAYTLTKAAFGCPAAKDADKNVITHADFLKFFEDYSSQYKKAAISGNLNAFKSKLENAFTRDLSEANSKNKNTTVAMISRLLITTISTYFFVNDYRNQVLIESKGKDIEHANATMKERIGHKVMNFFLNSMFMDLFNTTFEKTYLGSLLGATAVAMATEFTNETAVRKSICTPTVKMSREELIEYENKRLNDKGLKGDYYRAFMKLTGKKPLSEKAKS